jgi:hypothetical protein
MTPGEQLACEWEARHDVVARARRSDPAAALQHYMSHVRCTEPEHASAPPAPRAKPEPDPHPLAHQWLRWGEEPVGRRYEGRRLTDAG